MTEKDDRPAHARLGASGSYRWLACATSPAMEDHFEETSSEFADEGTLAHAAGSFCLYNNCDPSVLLGYDQNQLNVLTEQDDITHKLKTVIAGQRFETTENDDTNG